MNTLKIEQTLSKKYKYKPLKDELSEKYRQFFKDNVPEWINVNGSKDILQTINGSVITNGYDRIVIGDYGAFVEFTDEQSNKLSFITEPGQEYRQNDERYSTRVKYLWLTIDDDSHIKIYYQKRPVAYADYQPGKYYVSVHEVYLHKEKNGTDNN